MSGGKFSGWDRRNFFQVAAAAGLIAAAPRTASAAQPSESEANVAPQPTPQPGADTNTSDIVVGALIDWGATHVLGIVGDGINSIIARIGYVISAYDINGAKRANGPPSVFVLRMNPS
jgi:hypothetical protein